MKTGKYLESAFKRHELDLFDEHRWLFEIKLGKYSYFVCGCDLCVDYVGSKLRMAMAIRSDLDRKSSESDRPTSNLDLFPPTGQ